MSYGLHSISSAAICQLYAVTPRTVHRWLNEPYPAPRLRDGTEHFYALGDLISRVSDPMPLLSYQRQTPLTAAPDIDLGLEVAGRARQLWEALDDAQRNRAAKIQATFRETIARAFWEKLQHLDGQHLANALLLHPAIIQAVFGDDLPENWEDFCISFTIKNTPTKAIWRLAMTHTYQEGKRNVA